MTKDEAKAALQAGGHMLYSRASMGARATARVNGQPLRADTAVRLMKELGLRPDKPFGLTKTYRLPQTQLATAASADQAQVEAPRAPASKDSLSP